MDILGVRVDNLEKSEVLEKVSAFLNDPHFHQISTINPEFVLETRRDTNFKNILNASDLNVADGVGLAFAFWRKKEKLKSRFAGADLMLSILEKAAEKNFPIFLATSSEGLSSWRETRTAILKLHPHLKIFGADLTGRVTTRFSVSTLDKKLHEQGNWIVFCNFGAPFQELFLKNQKNDRIRLAMGVGGSFDYLTGKIRRAPVFMRKFGLEWLWRFLRQPWRLGRILRAVIVFPVRVILGK